MAVGDKVPRNFKRVELHVHLDGSIDLDALYEICRARNLELPGGIGRPTSSADVERYLSTHPGWHRFDVVNDIIGGNVTTIRSAAVAFVSFQARSGVLYTEVRYDPVRLATSSLANCSISEEAAVQAVQEGLAEGAARYGVSVYQLLCAMRGRSSDHCFRTAHLAAKMRSRSMGGVVGLDLAGDEVDYPNAPYIDCFRYAKRTLGLNTTVHAGEFLLNESSEVRSAIVEMEADRIGHGYAVVKDPDTMAMMRAKRVHLEACPASAQNHGKWALKAIATFRSEGLSFGLNTDDPASFLGNTSASEDESIVMKHLDFNSRDIERAYLSASMAAFGPFRGLPSLAISDIVLV